MEATEQDVDHGLLKRAILATGLDPAETLVLKFEPRAWTRTGTDEGWQRHKPCTGLWVDSPATAERILDNVDGGDDPHAEADIYVDVMRDWMRIESQADGDVVAYFPSA